MADFHGCVSNIAGPPMTIRKLDDLFLTELQETYAAEKLIVAPLSKLAIRRPTPRRATSPAAIIASIGLSRSSGCLGGSPIPASAPRMGGMLAEVDELIGSDPTTSGHAAAVLSVVETVRHYLMARYVTLRRGPTNSACRRFQSLSPRRWRKSERAQGSTVAAERESRQWKRDQPRRAADGHVRPQTVNVHAYWRLSGRSQLALFSGGTLSPATFALGAPCSPLQTSAAAISGAGATGFFAGASAVDVGDTSTSARGCSGVLASVL